MLMLASKQFYKENVNIMIFTDDVYHLFNVVTFTNFKLWWKSRTLPKLLQFIIWGSRITKVFETNHIGTTILVFYTIFHCHPPNICWDISPWIKVAERLTDRQKRVRLQPWLIWKTAEISPYSSSICQDGVKKAILHLLSTHRSDKTLNTETWCAGLFFSYKRTPIIIKPLPYEFT